MFFLVSAFTDLLPSLGWESSLGYHVIFTIRSPQIQNQENDTHYPC